MFSYIGGPCSLSYIRLKDVRSQRRHCFCPFDRKAMSDIYVIIYVSSCNQYLGVIAIRFHYTLQFSSNPKTFSIFRTPVDEILICLSNATINGFIVYRNVRESVILHLPSRARARLRPSIETSFDVVWDHYYSKKYGHARR